LVNVMALTKCALGKVSSQNLSNVSMPFNPQRDIALRRATRELAVSQTSDLGAEPPCLAYPTQILTHHSSYSKSRAAILRRRYGPSPLCNFCKVTSPSSHR
jgi:hypothetical protein